MERPGKIVCVGRNYSEHARELGSPVPEYPLIFLKPPSAWIPNGAEIRLPEVSAKVEHEGEIGVVIGSILKDAGEAACLEGIAGIVCVNDVTARDLQKTDGQWTRAKGFDTFCPAGPEPVPVAADRLVDLEVICRVDGQVRQHGRASDMIFPIPFLLSWISRVMTLEPGDLVATGTPEGVGPLRAGEQVEVEIAGVGNLSNPVSRAGAA